MGGKSQRLSHKTVYRDRCVLQGQIANRAGAQGDPDVTCGLASDGRDQGADQAGSLLRVEHVPQLVELGEDSGKIVGGWSVQSWNRPRENVHYGSKIGPGVGGYHNKDRRAGARPVRSGHSAHRLPQLLIPHPGIDLRRRRVPVARSPLVLRSSARIVIPGHTVLARRRGDDIRRDRPRLPRLLQAASRLASTQHDHTEGQRIVHGGIVVVPPSRHSSGASYQRVFPLPSGRLAEIDPAEIGLLDH